ncbi:hypothetical protein WJR50_28670 [Catalinimonas sp. 4WD22]|uniref:hypothetical protein n=1 Tax=Catalinimonas locisalis TaxID=3133978 RepID=UPI003100AD11
MIKTINTLILCWIALSYSMAQPRSVALEDYYTPKEILELHKLIQFVNEGITKNCDDTQLACYNKFFNQFNDLKANEDAQIPLSQTGELQLLESLDADIFEDIWRICEYERFYKKDSSIFLQSICLNPEGRFAKFLIDLKDHHEKLNHYGEPFKITGLYTPAMNGILLKYHDWFNIESQSELFLMAVHLLTLNYPEKQLKN